MVDYSKWKDIEISDDEDETHPNIDTPSLFRWRHQARVERMQERQKEKDALQLKRSVNENERQEKVKLLQQKKSDGIDVSSLEKEIKKLEEEREKIKKEQAELENQEKLAPWNVDTISQEGFAKTVVNKPPPRVEQEKLSEEEEEKQFQKFCKDNISILKQFALLRRYDDSKQFLSEHPQLVCEGTANYLVVHCINLEMEEKHNLMEHVAHQCICMQYILELSKQLNIDPRACVALFYSRIDKADEQYKMEFDKELESFKSRIKRRAQEKLDVLLKETEAEEKEKRLGPGGLDPIEVYESLPEELKKCFDSSDIDMLKETIAKMDVKDAAYHMKRCIDSGLWVPSKEDEEEENAVTESSSSLNEELK